VSGLWTKLCWWDTLSCHNERSPGFADSVLISSEGVLVIESGNQNLATHALSDWSLQVTRYSPSTTRSHYHSPIPTDTCMHLGMPGVMLATRAWSCVWHAANAAVLASAKT
jgi:hypothetical protein